MGNWATPLPPLKHQKPRRKHVPVWGSPGAGRLQALLRARGVAAAACGGRRVPEQHRGGGSRRDSACLRNSCFSSCLDKPAASDTSACRGRAPRTGRGGTWRAAKPRGQGSARLPALQRILSLVPSAPAVPGPVPGVTACWGQGWEPPSLPAPLQGHLPALGYPQHPLIPPDPRSPFPKGWLLPGSLRAWGLHQAPRANPKLGGNSNTEPPARHRAARFDGGSARQGSGALFLGLSPARSHPGWRQEPRGAPARGAVQPIFIRHHFPAAPPRPKPPRPGPEHTQGPRAGPRPCPAGCPSRAMTSRGSPGRRRGVKPERSTPSAGV